MAVYRRKDSQHWHYDFTVKGNRFRGSAETPDKATAEAVEAKARADAILGGLTGKKPTLTLDQAFGKYFIEHAQHLPSADTIETQLAVLLAGLGKHTRLDEPIGAKLSDYIAMRRGQKIRRPGKRVHRNPDRLVGPKTINDEVALLRTVYRRAAYRWQAAVEMPSWKDYWLTTPDGRTRYLKDEEARRVMGELAPHIRPIVEAALLTGLRLSQVVRLDWSQINMRAREMTFLVKSKKHKGGKRITVPISEALLILLANQGPREMGPVWRRKGRPVKDIKWGYNAAVRRAGLEDFTFHDLRHTAASWMRQDGNPLEAVRDMLGHADIRTTQRYAHIGDDAAKRAADSLSRTMSRLRHGPEIESAKPLKRAGKSKT